MQLNDLNDRVIQHIVPGGKTNAAGARWWRDFYQNIVQVIEDIAQNVVDTNQAEIIAQTASTDLTAHVQFAATPTDIGHVLQASATNPQVTVSPGPAPLIYDQAQMNAVIARLNDAHNRIDDLTAKLQAAGIMV